MITVKIDEEILLELLMKRVGFWTDDEDTLKLFEMYYSDRINNSCFEDCELDINVIVDNDYVNYYRVIDKDDNDFNWAIENDDRIVARLNDDNDTMLVYMA